MTKYFIVLSLLSFILSSCDNKTEVIEKFENGQPKLINYYIDKDKKIFDQKELNENGSLRTLRHFIDGKQEGFEYGYYQTGEKGVEEMYKNGERNGITREYHKNGHIRFEGYYYPDSNFCGHSTWYYDNGKIKETGTRRKNSAIGIWTEYYRNGNKKRVIDYNNSNSTLYYDTTGEKITREEYDKVNPNN